MPRQPPTQLPPAPLASYAAGCAARRARGVPLLPRRNLHATRSDASRRARWAMCCCANGRAALPSPVATQFGRPGSRRPRRTREFRSAVWRAARCLERRAGPAISIPPSAQAGRTSWDAPIAHLGHARTRLGLVDLSTEWLSRHMSRNEVMYMRAQT